MRNILIDTATIKLKAGNGGDGRVSFRREKFIPRGGPDGGDGGNGGHVYFEADNNMGTLMDFRAKPFYEAENGESGGKKKMYGGAGEELIIKVPVGTLVYELKGKNEILVSDLNESGKRFLIALGGVAGKGNFRFKSSTNRTPMQYTEGTKGEVKEIRLEVKLIADIGLVGAPNAGKSTLLNKLTKASAKVASYPFTTLSPNLGTYTLKNGKTIIIADIPGLIEGASEGKGLGDDFLRHVERTRLLIHLIDPMSLTFESGVEAGSDDADLDLAANSFRTYKMLKKELVDYGGGLEDKGEVIAINKVDLTEVADSLGDTKKVFEKELGDVKVFGISAATGEGIEALMNEVMKRLDELPEKVVFEEATPVKLYTIDNLPNSRIVFRDRKKERRIKLD